MTAMINTLTVNDGRPTPQIHATRLPGPEARMPGTTFTFTRSYLVKITSINDLITRTALWLIDVREGDLAPDEPGYLIIHLAGLPSSLDGLERELS